MSDEPAHEQHAPERERQIVVTIRRRRPRPPWSMPRAVSWAAVVLAGTPLLVLMPVMLFVAWLLAAYGVGAPAHAEVVVPLIVPPPADAYQDIGVIGLSSLTGAAVWVARAAAAAARAVAFAMLAATAVARARGQRVSIKQARQAVAARAGTVSVLAGLSFGYGLLISQQASLDPARDASVAASALAVGMLFLPGAFVAAMAGRGPGGSLRRGLAPRRPLGHVALVAGYGLALNGIYRLASFGDARPRALPLALYGTAAAMLTAVFVLALARRAILLDPDEQRTGSDAAPQRPAPAPTRQNPT